MVRQVEFYGLMLGDLCVALGRVVLISFAVMFIPILGIHGRAR